jgi:hypothetical protein
MLVQPWPAKQEIEGGFQVDHVELDVEGGWSDLKRDIEHPQHIVVHPVERLHALSVGRISSGLNPSLRAVLKGQTLTPAPSSTIVKGIRKSLYCTVMCRGRL